MIKRVFPDLRGKRVLVASSGDNVAVFGFHLLGADVTSTDLSERQLENAAKLATARGWNIQFACTDSMTLEGIADHDYDLVYTSNGVHVWINDLAVMYQSFYRVLRAGGYYIYTGGTNHRKKNKRITTRNSIGKKIHGQHSPNGSGPAREKR